ncbi:MAG: hypothetical protein H0U19_11385 [Acidobacteria bacterium]|nr:hypothetical protein [Acidobacteriota bacterium]
MEPEVSGYPWRGSIIGGMPERFTTFVGLYREGARRAGKEARLYSGDVAEGG